MKLAVGELEDELPFNPWAYVNPPMSRGTQCDLSTEGTEHEQSRHEASDDGEVPADLLSPDEKLRLGSFSDFQAAHKAKLNQWLV